MRGNRTNEKGDLIKRGVRDIDVCAWSSDRVMLACPTRACALSIGDVTVLTVQLSAQTLFLGDHFTCTSSHEFAITIDSFVKCNRNQEAQHVKLYRAKTNDV